MWISLALVCACASAALAQSAPGFRIGPQYFAKMKVMAPLKSGSWQRFVESRPLPADPKVELNKDNRQPCSIPLVNVLPEPAARSNMPVVAPRGVNNLAHREVSLPAPPCDDKKR